jgi:hypothetical protein
MSTRATLLVEIDTMLDGLSGALGTTDLRGGWGPDCQRAMRSLYERFREDVRSGVDVSRVPEYVSTVRGLDHWGVSSGPLFERAARISVIARALSITDTEPV